MACGEERCCIHLALGVCATDKEAKDRNELWFFKSRNALVKYVCVCVFNMCVCVCACVCVCVCV